MPCRAGTFLVLAAGCTPPGALPTPREPARDATVAACPILADPDLARGSTLPPLPLARPLVAYPSSLADDRRDGDSARVRLAVDRDGAVPPCAVTVQAVSDSALLPHVAAAAGTLRFEPARLRGAAVPAWLTMTLRFGSAAQLAAAPSAPPSRVEVVVQQSPVLRPGAPQPAYPTDLLAQRVTGRVVIRATVTTDGLIDLRSVRIVRSDHPSFTTAVRDVLPRLRFEPARMGPGGAAVEAPIQWAFDFAP